MSATTLMMIAIAAAVIGRWAHNKPLGDATTVVKIVFALVVIASLDQGKTAPLAMGFAWLFLVAVLLSDSSPLTGIAKAVNTKKAS